MTDLFAREIVSNHAEYLALRDEPRNAELRKYCLELWRGFAPYADRDFISQFALHLHRRFWEMYLGVALLERGFDLRPRGSSDGPDLHLVLDGKDVWIEATAPSEGVGKDSVPTLEEHSRFEIVPDDKIALRFTSSISEKKQRLDSYLHAGIIGPNDAFVIAINGARIQMTLLDGPMPTVVKAVYPIGDHQVIIDTIKNEVIEERYATRRAILKASGSAVSTQSFIDPSYSGVSGVLYARKTLAVHSEDAVAGFLFVHNHQAQTPLANGWLGAGREYWVEDGHLRST